MTMTQLPLKILSKKFEINKVSWTAEVTLLLHLPFHDCTQTGFRVCGQLDESADMAGRLKKDSTRMWSELN